MTTTLFFTNQQAITHACKPLFKRRTAVVDGSAGGVMAALAFTVVSVAQLSATLLAVGWLIVLVATALLK